MEMSLRRFSIWIVGFAVLTMLAGCIGFQSATLEKPRLPMRITDAQGKPDIIPILIIGSGPAGLTAGYYAADSHIPTVILEGNMPGGLLTQTSEVLNWPGIFNAFGPDIMKENRKQAIGKGAHIMHDAVESLDVSSWPYRIKTQGGNVYHVLSIIVSTGATPRMLGVPGEQEYWGRGVTSCALCDAPFYIDSNVVVVGGGDSAIEEAIQLSGYAKNITILVRRDKMYAASASMQKRLEGYPKISVKYNVAIQAIHGNDEGVTHVTLVNTQTKQLEDFPTEGVFLAIGHDPNTALVKEILETDANGYIKLRGRSQRTSVPLIYAAGDVEDHEYRQAGVAAGSGIRAGLDAVNDLGAIGYTEAIEQELNIIKLEKEPQFPEEVIRIHEAEEFHDVINRDAISIIYFYGKDCPKCPQMTANIAHTAPEFGDEVTFGVVNLDKAKNSTLNAIITEYFIHKIPCVLVFKQGTLAGRFNDVMSQNEFVAYIEKFLHPELHQQVE